MDTQMVLLLYPALETITYSQFHRRVRFKEAAPGWLHYYEDKEWKKEKGKIELATGAFVTFVEAKSAYLSISPQLRK